MPITSSGLGSGIDIKGLVTKLVAAQADPVNSLLNKKETKLNSQLSAIGTLKSALSTFQSSVTKLSAASTFQAFTATSSNTSAFTATATTQAVAGNYNVEVVQLAQAEKLHSGNFTAATDVVGTGTITIAQGTGSFQLTIDSTNNTLQGIRDAINAAPNNTGVTASLINVDSGTQLVLTSTKVGASNAINVTAVDNNTADAFDLTRLDGTSLVTLQAATDAKINIDSQAVTRSSNSFSDVIPGVTFNLVSAQPGTTNTLAVASDTQSIKNDIQSFVTNYNNLSGVMKGLSHYDPTTKVAAALNGDFLIRGLQGSVEQALTTSISGGALSNLSQLGITLDATGSLSINSSVLDSKLSNNLSDVKQFFSSATGMANTFTNSLSGYVATDGILDLRSSSIQTQINSIGGERTDLTRRMDALRKRLNAQFIAMDTMVAQLRSTGTFLTQQLASLPTPGGSASTGK